MSKNFFAALDDDDDDDVKPVVKQAPPKVQSVTKPVATEPIKEHRRPNNNDRNTKHGRGERAPTKSGKRAYDRRSGTGRGTETKKEGAGARNWGSDKNEAKKAVGPVDENDVDPTLQVASDEEPKTEEVESEPPVAEEVVEEVDNTISFDEYLETKNRLNNVLLAPKEERKVENEFATIKPKVATEEDFLVMGDKRPRARVREEKKKDTIVPSFKVVSSDAVVDDRRDGAGRGGRGRGDRGGRGGRGRGREGGRGRDGRGGDRGRGSTFY